MQFHHLNYHTRQFIVAHIHVNILLQTWNVTQNETKKFIGVIKGLNLKYRVKMSVFPINKSPRFLIDFVKLIDYVRHCLDAYVVSILFT